MRVKTLVHPRFQDGADRLPFFVLAVGMVFGQTIRLGFVNYDDDCYVYKNDRVACGLSGQGILWAFTTTHTKLWQPLTWLF